ncbi:hypothetical protein AB0G73_37555 [Streptomyces sp. NPDC020719]|uniref:hypothetical protein n=1 Tax=Streptomyces sp. NPDC020719 TaxID=3154896 RepID=UPI0033F73479
MKTPSDALPTFPIEEYLPKRSEDGQLKVAAESLIRVCMSDFGFKYMGREISGKTLSSQENGTNKPRRYGVVDIKVAESYGYHPADMPIRENATEPSGPGMSDAENRVFIGDGDPSSGVKPGDKYSGKPIPRGGCAGQAAETLGTNQLGRTAKQINNISFARSMENNAVKTVFRKWSSCMAAQGYKFDSPMRALEQSLTSQVTASEVAMAKADVNCKRKVNLVGVWFTVESEIQKELIGRQEETLVGEKKALTDALRKAAKISSGGGQ